MRSRKKSREQPGRKSESRRAEYSLPLNELLGAAIRMEELRLVGEEDEPKWVAVGEDWVALALLLVAGFGDPARESEDEDPGPSESGPVRCRAARRGRRVAAAEGAGLI